MISTEASGIAAAPGPEGAGALVTHHEGAATWMLEPIWRDRLFDPEAPDWFALETSPAAEHVKAGHQREVWRVRLAGADVYAKVRRSERGRAGWLGRAARAHSGAQREWKMARRVWARGVPVPHFVAFGQRRGDDPAEILISEAISGAQTLAATWAETGSYGISRRCENPCSHKLRRQALPARGSERRTREQIINAVATLFGQGHRRGFAHRDNHPQNILLYHHDGGLSAVFVDVIPATLSRHRCSYRRIVASLAHLDQYFHRVATRTERLRFVSAYLQTLNAERGMRDERLIEHDLVPAILRERAGHALRLARRRDQRIWRRGKYFSTFEIEKTAGQTLRATVVLDLERRHLFPEPEIPDRSEAEWRSILRAFIDGADDSGRARELARHRLQCETMQPRNFLQRLNWTLFGSPHRRAFACAHKLRHRDIAAPLLLAYVEERNKTIHTSHLMYGPT